MTISLKKMFLLSFTVAILAKAMDALSFTGNYPSYIYSAYCILFGILLLGRNNGKLRGLKTKAFQILLALIVYYFIWGAILVAPNVNAADPRYLMYRTGLMLAFVFISYMWISELDCIQEAIRYTYIGLLCFMLVLFVLHIREIDLPGTLANFWGNSESPRSRTPFGFNANNLAAELAMSVILLSLMSNSLRHSTGLTWKKLLVILGDLIMFVIIIANNSRGTLIAALLMLSVYGLFLANRRYGIQKTIKVLFGIAALAVIGLLIYLKRNGLTMEEFLATTNRYHFLDNINILNASGRKWIGLGNLSGGFFKNENYLFGYRTNYMEMFYVGVYVRTGILGSIFMLWILVRIFYQIVKAGENNKTFLGRWFFLVYIYMLFLSFFEQYLFSNSYTSAILFLTLIFSHIQKSELTGSQGEVRS